MQATLARIVGMRDEAAAFVARVADKEIWIMREDKEDFEAVKQEVVEQAANMNVESLEVYVKAL